MLPIDPQLYTLFEAYAGPRPVVFCDLDGVLADFNGKMKEYFPETDLSSQAKIVKLLSKHASWELIGHQHPHLFAELDVLTGANALMDRLIKMRDINFIELKILTAYPYEWKDDPERINIVTIDKINWMKQHFPKIDSSDVIVCRRDEKPSHGKKAFQSTGIRPLLIDDMEQNIREWRYEGFQGILYKTPNQAVSEINQYLQAQFSTIINPYPPKKRTK